MKAVLCSSYGPPENLTLEEIVEPIAGEGEALVEVYAASLKENISSNLLCHLHQAQKWAA